ncbi:Hermansky-Pudlak syndrome 5 protein homolog isoform X1 [Neodiprion fabricii]|uniref:Hermansky-Pudlak syndrome 5 protein homolog isoform X1 n=2 Tax=Neodiprion fabricii TaxID=2872261 RepID=UPI001ED8DD98|nr:Hermansky-Pudlak syndrome 5 protein homolog isoform X1 [Neodiprion fabricii]
MAQDVTWVMTEAKDLMLSEYKEITTLLQKPIKDKRRIKYTCFDVSSNFIALGSTSGSIYLFARDTCIFQQLIPLSNGAVAHILISPDQKVVALSTVDGNVCLIVLKPTVKEAMISTKSERNGECVTALCWNDNSTELYIGDENGTVHVMGLSMFTVKRGIFQDPACPIMGLNYKIVQMDFCSPLLLISTISNCYICDTLEGQYEKVGLRTRQGEFGACFYNPSTIREADVSATQQKHSPSTNKEFKSTKIDKKNQQYPKIYCARPGSRLWEAESNGKIVKTHNFKEALAIPPSTVHKSIGSKMTCAESSNCDWSPQSLKFSPLHIIASKYLLTYNSNALYIFDPVNSAVILWCNEYTDVAAANVVDNQIYVMTNSGDFHCLELTPTPSSMSNQIEKGSKLDSGIVVVNNKNSKLLKYTKNEEISEVEKKCNSNNKLPVEFRKELNKCELSVLNSQNLIARNTKEDQKNEFNDIVRLDAEYIDIDKELKNGPSQKHVGVEETMNIEENLGTTKDEIRNLMDDVQVIYSLVNSLDSIMSDDEIDKILCTVRESIKCVKESCEKLTEPKPSVLKAINTVEQYYKHIFLSRLNKDRLIETKNENILNEAMSSFLEINVLHQVECECGFPYLTKQPEEPKFFKIGIVILQKYSEISKETCINLCKKVPYMWRPYVNIYSKQEDFFEETTFVHCLQTRDDLVLSFLLLSLNGEQWKFAMKAISNLQLKKCLGCNGPITATNTQNDLSINWNNIAHEIMKREGPDVSVNFLTTIATILPSVSFSKNLFQSLIFTKILKHHEFEQPMDFDQILNETPYDPYSLLCCPKIQTQLLHTLQKDLQRPMDRQVFGTQAHHWGMHHKPAKSICPCCTLPLKTPVLLDNNGLSLFPCGHSYHVNCLIQKRVLKCNLHNN